MDAETRLNKRIEIAARMAAGILSNWTGCYEDIPNAKREIIDTSFIIADAIISEAEKTN